MENDNEMDSYSNITTAGLQQEFSADPIEHMHRIHSIFMSLKSTSPMHYTKPRFQINLAKLPKEVVKKIAAQLEPEERLLSVKTLGQRFNDVCYEVLSFELRNIGPMIYGQLEDSKDEVMTGSWNSLNIKELMFKVSQYTLLQIMNGEYNLLCCIYLDREGYISKNAMNYQIIDNLNEFNNLLRDSADKKFDWHKSHVNDVLKRIRLLNQKAFEMFFIRCWNIKMDRFGPLLMKILNCAMNSNFRISLSHLEIPKRIDSKCYIHAQYEIADEINTLEVPSFFQLEIDRFHFLRLFLLFICNSIRMENMNTTLKMRRACLDLAISSQQQMLQRRWFEKKFPYVDSLPILLAENLVNLPTNLRKVTRVIEKPGESLSNTPGWQGMRMWQEWRRRKCEGEPVIWRRNHNVMCNWWQNIFY
ncbi:uncharacterized protein isoform X2 [Rhodnius prolixus]|uniref:uncharacterized protein isoform X2 n=1 Tax=Rhodnius prolixus TaxID=13249 RepID=UPI003D18F1A5